MTKSCCLIILLALFSGLLMCINAHFDYRDTLTKYIIFLETQRSGKLPPNPRPPWRGDNVKYGFRMAFTVKTIALAAYFYGPELTEAGGMNNLLYGIRWGTDYFLKASCQENRLFVQVGDPNMDHKCWMRPENMKTPRTMLEITKNRPGTEIAAETAADLAASSIVYCNVDKPYSEKLLDTAKKLFQFAEEYKGTFDGA